LVDDPTTPEHRSLPPEPPRPDGRAADFIIEQIEQKIASGEFADRTPLPAERDLMAQYGASRTVVREAITALSNRGLVESRPRFRPIVKKPGYDTALDAVERIVLHLLGQPDGVKNLYESRIYIERTLVREAAMNARKEDITSLKDALATNFEAIDGTINFHTTDMAFHGVLYRIPRNPIFPVLHDAYTSWLTPYWRKMINSPERNRVNYQSHRRICDAILERDPDAAEIALISHLNAALDYVRGSFEFDRK